MDTASRVALLLLALGLAVQPWSVIASVLLVASRNGTRRAIAFVLGWVCALSVVAVGTAVLSTPSTVTTTQSTALSVVDIVIGLLLAAWLLVRVRRGRRKPADAPPAEPPTWMARIDTMPTAAAFVLGGFLPTYVFVVAAVGQMLQSGLSGGALLAAAVVFVAVASLGVAAPLIVMVVRRDDAPRLHEVWRTWLITNADALTGWIIGVIAVLLVVKGTVGLLT